MCNLYSLYKGQDHIRREFQVNWDDTGNMPPLPGIFPDAMAPIVRADSGGRRMQMARWGMPTPPKFLKAGAIDRGVTNVRNTSSAHWRRWLKPEFRCLVPATSFSEPSDVPNPATGKKDWAWFALSEERPLFAFACLWCNWTGVRGTKKNPVEGEHRLYAFLTTEPNGIVATVYTKAMPVILTTAMLGPPSFTPRALAALWATLVRSEIIARSCSATDTAGVTGSIPVAPTIEFP